MDDDGRDYQGRQCQRHRIREKWIKGTYLRRVQRRLLQAARGKDDARHEPYVLHILQQSCLRHRVMLIYPQEGTAQ